MSTEYNFEKLRVYQEALDFAETIYQNTQGFPDRENFGITSQIRRAAVSISSNLAEGSGRHHTKVFLEFLYQSRGSLYEVMTLIKLSQRLKYLDSQTKEELLRLSDQIAIKLSNLINSLRKKD